MPENQQTFFLEIGSFEIVRKSGNAVVCLQSCDEGPTQTAESIPQPARTTRAEQMQSLLDAGQVKSRSELARRFNISRARVTQILGPKRK